MRRIRTFTIIFLILLLLMSGCDSAGTQETTLPPETTVPVETTLPPETTVPPETTAPPETEPSEPTLEDIPFHAAYLADGFVHYYGEPSPASPHGYDYQSIVYQYTGDSPVIELKSMGLTLTLPDGWLDRVMVFRYWNHPYNEGFYIVNKDLWNAHYEGKDFESPHHGLQDYVLHVHCKPADRYYLYGGPESYPEAFYEADELVYFLSTEAELDGFHYAYMREELIERIGQDAFDELIGDLVLDDETAKSMITFTY